MNELQWDKKLNIRTASRDASHADIYHYPYEPTPYAVLQRLVESGYLDADCFYFFNPFSAEILKSVMEEIIASYYEDPREMRLFFYYPNDEYLAYLITRDELMFVDEIDCQDLFEGKDERERILIFEVI